MIQLVYIRSIDITWYIKRQVIDYIHGNVFNDEWGM